MHFWTDKSGKKLTFKEFKQRWSEGIAGITQLQLVSQQLRGMNIILLGLLCGIVVCCFNIKNLWWLLIILIGSLYVNITQYIGTWQKKKAYEDVENRIKKLDKESNKDNPDLKGGKKNMTKKCEKCKKKTSKDRNYCEDCIQKVINES